MDSDTIQGYPQSIRLQRQLCEMYLPAFNWIEASFKGTDWLCKEVKLSMQCCGQIG